MSEELIAPDALRSNLKLAPVVACPDLAFSPLMSLEFTDRVLFTSPVRKLTDTGGGLDEPFTLSSETLTRWLSGMLFSATTTSFPKIIAVAVPIGATLTLPADATGPLN